ncbi:hypothetical protein VTL71DRAFT_4131 [Oculimacula yallundae]|uniref:Uncharacterized protein n=1 Tax=Oculimacula yallundae TaxID=86028 RepID=A0ABR4C4Z0_9HELO
MPKVSKIHGQRHHSSSKNPDHQARRHPSGGEHRTKDRDVQPPNENFEKALSGDNDYVRRWLAQTEREPNQSEQLGPTEFTFDQGQTRGAYAKIPSHGLILDSANSHGILKEKRKRHSSSDSSLLEVPARPRSYQLKRDDPQPALFNPPEIQPTPTRKKQRVGSSDSSLTNRSDVPDHTKETFERRARHKTREDRYEAKKKEPKKSKTRGETPSRKKREKRGDRAKVAKKAGEELIQKFNSKNISQDRLTIRPSHGLGLFNNGRASSPARRRGLPDLAFSEMEFLRHSTGHHANTGDNVISRSREKEKKKAAKVQDEISAFFKPRAPLRDLSSNLDGPPSSPPKEDHSLYAKKLASQRNTRNRTPPNHLGPGFEQPGKHRAATLSPSQHRTIRRYSFSSEIGRSTDPSGSASRISGQATTYVSWSESQRSPALTPSHGNFDRRQLSQTPESVRRAIENTGIFRDTGISRNSSMQPLRDGNGGHGQGAFKSRLDNQNGKTAPEIASSSEAGPEISETHLRDKTRTLQDFSRHNISNELTDPSHELPSTDGIGTMESNGVGRSRQRLVTAINKDDTRQSDSTRQLSREQIAKNARIELPKRPSATVPVVRNIVSDANISQDAEIDEQTDQDTARRFQTREGKIRVGISSMYANPGQRPLFSRVSNFSLPIIHEDSHENSTGHDEFMPQIQPGSKNSFEASQPRLSLTSHNKESQLGSQNQQQQIQARDPIVLQTSRMDKDGSHQDVSLGGTWIGNSLGGIPIGPPKLLPSTGAESLYLRQLRGHTPSHRFAYGSAHRLEVPLWGLSVPANDKDPAYLDQQDAAQFAPYRFAAGHSTEPAMNQEYDETMDDLDVENFYQPEADDQNFGDPSILRSDHVYKNEQLYEEEHTYATPYQAAHQGFDGDFATQANNYRNRFWRSQDRY